MTNDDMFYITDMHATTTSTDSVNKQELVET
jgi:hypothetical protein